MQFHAILALSAISLFSLYISVYSDITDDIVGDIVCYFVSLNRYSGRNCEGAPSDDAFQSILLGGNMIVYESNNPLCSLGRMEYYFSPFPACINLTTYAHSYWYAGNGQNMCEDFISLFRYGSFHGTRWETDRSGKAKLFFNPQSLIVLGNSSWTLYEKEDFIGRSFCVKIKYSDLKAPHPNFFTDTSDLFPGDFVPRSVAKGCW